MSDRCRKSNDTFVTMNNNFLGHLTSSLVKIIGKSSHSWPKIVIHGDSCIILYICMCFFYNEGTLPCSPHFPSLCEPEFQYRNRFSVSITHCVILVIQTGPILPATGIHGVRVPMCSCVRKSKQMLLALIKCSRPWIYGHSSIQCLYCVISMEGDANIYGGKTMESHSWATMNSLSGDTFSNDNDMHGNRFNVSFMTGIHNSIHEFWKPWPNHAKLDPVLYRTIL